MDYTTISVDIGAHHSGNRACGWFSCSSSRSRRYLSGPHQSRARATAMHLAAPFALEQLAEHLMAGTAALRRRASQPSA